MKQDYIIPEMDIICSCISNVVTTSNSTEELPAFDDVPTIVNEGDPEW